jgi:hypothetical protein
MSLGTRKGSCEPPREQGLDQVLVTGQAAVRQDA